MKDQLVCSVGWHAVVSIAQGAIQRMHRGIS